VINIESDNKKKNQHKQVHAKGNDEDDINKRWNLTPKDAYNWHRKQTAGLVQMILYIFYKPNSDNQYIIEYGTC